MKRSHGTYSKHSRNFVSSGVKTLAKVLTERKEGELVRIAADPGKRSGRPHLRFNRTTGKIVGKQGGAYVVKIMDGNKEKTLFVTPEHLETA